MPDVPRLSRKQATVLNLLTTIGESYGLELVKGSGGALKRGTVYVTLSRMEDRGLVGSRLETAPPGYQGPPRRKYKPTGLGEAALASWLEELASSFGGLKLVSS